MHAQHAQQARHWQPAEQAPQGGHAAHGEHGGEHGDHVAQFRDRFWLSLALSLPVVVYSEMVQDLLGFTAPRFPGSGWVAPAFGTAVFLYGGWPFLAGAVRETRARRPGMMLLIGLALERMRTVDAVLFDKTGTLTRGQPVGSWRPSPGPRSPWAGRRCCASSDSRSPRRSPRRRPAGGLRAPRCSTWRATVR